MWYVIGRSIGWMWLASQLLVATAHAESDLLSPQQLSELEDALAERNTNLQGRLELVARFDQLLAAASEPKSSATRDTEYKVRFVEALTNLRLSKLDLAASQVASLRSRVDAQAFPVMAFRCRSLQAAILLMQGKKNESLQALDELLASDVRNIPTMLLDQARTNRAAALKECGRVDEAIDDYQSIMLSCIQHENDKTALQAGNNLIFILLARRNFHAVREALKSLKPILERNPTSIGAQAVNLRELELQLLDGDPAQAIVGLNEFIERKREHPFPLLAGSAHRLLAQALEANNDLEGAIDHARQAVTLLSVIPNEVSARVVLAELLLHKQDYSGVLAELNKIDSTIQPDPDVQRRIDQAKLEARLREAGKLEEADLMVALLKKSQAGDQALSAVVADNFEQRLAALRADMSSQQLAAEKRVLQAALSAERYRHYLIYGLAAVGGLFACVVGSISWRRRAERVKLSEQAAQNARLEALVESKTRELKANLEAQAEMAQALERKKRMETIGLLAGNVAHDINNLLQVIANANETLARSDVDEQLRRQALAVSDESLRHGSGIIRQILAYSRQQELSSHILRVNDYLSNSRALFHSAVGAKIKLTIDDQSLGLFIRVDPSHLTTSILNLLSNAADAMPEGGSVEVKVIGVELSETEAAHWSELPPGKYMLFSIRDSGCGMNAEQLARAFEPFYSTKCVGDGTGLGLSSVYGFVKQSGGDIRLVSTPGLGSVVEFVLPVSAPAVPSNEAPATRLSEPLANKRLLLVEDHQAVARSLMLLLTHLKLRATWVPSGDDAVKSLQQDSDYDFVLSDVHMPGTINGLALARFIRGNYPRIRVMLMSGYNDLPQDSIDVPLLHKPFKLNELSALLNQEIN